MNKQKLSTMQGKCVRVYPPARRIDEFRRVELETIDDPLIVESASQQELTLHVTRSGQRVVLGTDHVKEYMSDRGRSDGIL